MVLWLRHHRRQRRRAVNNCVTRKIETKKRKIPYESTERTRRRERERKRTTTNAYMNHFQVSLGGESHWHNDAGRFCLRWCTRTAAQLTDRSEASVFSFRFSIQWMHGVCQQYLVVNDLHRWSILFRSDRLGLVWASSLFDLSDHLHTKLSFYQLVFDRLYSFFSTLTDASLTESISFSLSLISIHADALSTSNLIVTDTALLCLIRIQCSFRLWMADEDQQYHSQLVFDRVYFLSHLLLSCSHSIRCSTDLVLQPDELQCSLGQLCRSLLSTAVSRFIDLRVFPSLYLFIAIKPSVSSVERCSQSDLFTRQPVGSLRYSQLGLLVLVSSTTTILSLPHGQRFHLGLRQGFICLCLPRTDAARTVLLPTSSKCRSRSISFSSCKTLVVRIVRTFSCPSV